MITGEGGITVVNEIVRFRFAVARSSGFDVDITYIGSRVCCSGCCGKVAGNILGGVDMVVKTGTGCLGKLTIASVVNLIGADLCPPASDVIFDWVINVGDEVYRVVDSDDNVVVWEEEIVAAVVTAEVVTEGRLYFRFAARLWLLSPDSA
jgi:hypothetical protein